MRRFMLAACVLALSIAAAANESFPFDKYPAEVFHGKPTVPHLETARARDFSTVILKGAKRGPNFAGHYAIVSWGCGTSCGSYVIVDSRSGRVYEPTELSNVELWLRGPVYRVDSTLWFWRTVYRHLSMALRTARGNTITGTARSSSFFE
jgi:hypothetical protein